LHPPTAKELSEAMAINPNQEELPMTAANQTTSTKPNIHGSESCNAMSAVSNAGTNPKRKLAKAILDVKPFMSPIQMRVMLELLKSEEGAHFCQTIAQLAQRIGAMPITYEQDGLGNQAVVHLHYFLGASDWYILEKDMDGCVRQAFGYAVLNGDEQCAELGYISIEEITRCGAELNLYFAPCTLADIKAKRRDCL